MEFLGYVKKKEEKKKKKKTKKTKKIIALFPFDYTEEVGKENAEKAFNSFAIQLQENDQFEPVSIKLFMNSNFNPKKAANIVQLMNGIKKVDSKIDYLCYCKIFESESSYGLFVALYPKNPHIKPSYYFRIFPNLFFLNSISKEIIQEIISRSYNKNRTLLNKNIFVKKFEFKYYKHLKSKSDKGSVLRLPHIDIGGVYYSGNVHFFNEILLYNLHVSRIFNVWNSNIKKYIKNYEVVPGNMNYIVSVKFDMSNTISKLTVHLSQKGKLRRKIASFIYTIRDFHLRKINNLMRKISTDITFYLLNQRNRKKIGLIELNRKMNDMVFVEDYFVGNGNLADLHFPIGQTNIRIDSKDNSSREFIIYNSPFKKNKKLYRKDDFFLLDLVK